MNVLKASVEDVKPEGVGLKTNKYNVDTSQAQCHVAFGPELFSNALHNYPAVPGYSIIQYLGNFYF